MLKGPVVLLSVTVAVALLGLSLIPSLLGFGNVAETACEICDHRTEAFSTSGLLLPVAASSIAGILLGSLLFWKPERQEELAAVVPERACANCGKGVLEESWNLCPFCGQSVALHEDEVNRVSAEEESGNGPEQGL